MAVTRPCVGCGYCCRKAPCVVALANMARNESPCEFLVWNQDRYWCKLVVTRKVRPNDIGVGDGCCSPLNTDRSRVQWKTN